MTRIDSLGALFLAFVLTAMLVACGGGNTTPSVSGPGAPANGTVSFSITLPTGGVTVTNPGSRAPQFAAPNGAASVAFTLVTVNGTPASGSSPTIANLSASSSDCTASASPITCQVTTSAPAGTDVFLATVYPQSNAHGTPLGSGSMSVSVVANQTTQAPATLSGTVASIALSIPATVPEGIATSAPVVLVAKDTSGNVILGTYSSPITLTDTDSSKQTTLSATTIPDSATAAELTIGYAGGAMQQPATIGATANGVAATSITPASFLPNETYPTVGQSTETTIENLSTTTTFIGGASPLPSPASGSSTTTSNISTLLNQSFNGVAGLVDVTTSASQANTVVGTANAYYKWVPTSSSNALEYVGGLQVVPAPSPSASPLYTYNTTCQAPYSEVYIEPLPTSSWNAETGTGPCTYTDTADNSSFADNFTETQANTGSYTSTDAFTMSISGATFQDTTQTTVNANGSGSETSDAVCTSGCTGTSYSVTVGTPSAIGAPIPVSYQTWTGPIPSPAPSSSPSPIATTIPNWYAAAGIPGGSLPAPIISNTYTAKGPATLPSSCMVPTTILGTSPSINEYDEAYDSFDPFYGYYASVTRNFTLNGVGIICSTQSSTSYVPNALNNLVNKTTTADTLSTTTTSDYVTVSSLQAAFRQSGSFAKALPFAAASLSLNSAMQQGRFVARVQRTRIAAMERRAERM